jgi:hypothetical protein
MIASFLHEFGRGPLHVSWYALSRVCNIV